MKIKQHQILRQDPKYRQQVHKSKKQVLHRQQVEEAEQEIKECKNGD
jgi:hypothetical protein